ncbi:MAG: hypothetical protein ACI9X0_002790, partial [Kiritimatiellia bacterium]
MAPECEANCTRRTYDSFQRTKLSDAPLAKEKINHPLRWRHGGT